MTTRATHPTAQALLGWMQANPARLRYRLDTAAAGGGDLSPMGDPSIVAHLAFVADAVAATAAPGHEEELRVFAAGAMDDLWRARERAEENMVAVGEAHALEARLQFGDGAGADPANREVVDRRVRVIGWTFLFLDELQEATGDSGLADRARDWMTAHPGVLADTIFTMDRRAKEAERARGGEDAISDPAVVNRIGQAAALQGNVRFLVEAIAATAKR